MAVNPELVEQAATWIAGSRKPAVFTGAGVSRESGIPTFREAGTGLWAQYDPQQLATVEGFLQDPKLVWEWYAYRRKIVAGILPNPGHRAIAELEELLDGLVVITQNIDGLHQRAGSRAVIELHGNINRVKCFQGDEIHENWSDEDFSGEIPPRCQTCGSYLRPDVVWFGETLPGEALTASFEFAESCDLMLVVGTSGQVQPAASLPVVARRSGARIVEVNPAPSEITSSSDILLEAKSGEILPEVVARAREIKQG